MLYCFAYTNICTSHRLVNYGVQTYTYYVLWNHIQGSSTLAGHNMKDTQTLFLKILVALLQVSDT